MKTPRCILLIACAVISGAAVLAEEPNQLPDAARRLRQEYLQSVETAVRPIRERYLVKLRTLKEQYTRAGKLEEAMALKQEIEQQIAHADRGGTPLDARPSYIGRWQCSFGGGPMEILPDRTARHGGQTGKWEVKADDLVISWKNGYKHAYPVSQTGDTLRGKEIPPSGNPNPIMLTRMQ